MFWREWRSGELGLMLAALALGVTLVTGISLFAERLHGAIVGEANVYLAADKVVQTSEVLDAEWMLRANGYGVKTARTAVFPTMVYAGDGMVLASLKAVSAQYPLRGTLEVCKENAECHSVNHGPEKNNAWVDESVLDQLKLKVGDVIDVGEKKFVIEYRLEKENDAGSSYYGMGVRVMISDAALETTQLVLPGSRVEYRYLFAGDADALAVFFAEFRPILKKGQRIITVEESQPGIAGAIEKAGLFLRLAGALGVLLSALAAAFSAQRYCDRHVDVVAALKTLGAGRQRILSLLLLQMGFVWILSTVFGFACGWVLQNVFLIAMADWVPASLPAAGWHPFALGAATSFICLLAFVLPVFWRLQKVPPWEVLRGEKQHFSLHWQDGIYVFAGITALLLFYSHSAKLVMYLLVGLLMVVLCVVVLGWLIMKATRRSGIQAGNVFRLGLSNVRRRGAYSLLQIVVFAIGFMLLSIMMLLRTSLLKEWQMQLPADAPNTFLINIAKDQIKPLEIALRGEGLLPRVVYPMVRGRLTGINGVKATEMFDTSVSEVYRELSLGWSEALPEDNAVVAGKWFDGTDSNTSQVSIEKSLSERLKVGVGDRLTFTIGNAVLDVSVASVRSLDWGKMTPNFYFLFPVGILDRFSATHITSFHVADAQQPSLRRVLRQFPAVTAYPVGEMIDRIQVIVGRAGLAIEIIMVLVLVAGVLVLMACLRASLDQRLHESALLRTLGAGKKLVLGSLAVEFIFLGVVAGVLAAAGAELSVLALQKRVFQMAYSLHPLLWFGLPLVAATVMGVVGTAFCYRAVSAPPAIVLRDSQV